MPKSRNLATDCQQCGNKLKWYQTKYCSNACQSAFQRNEYIARWKHGEISGNTADELLSDHIRAYMIATYGEKCSQCGWQERTPKTGRVPLAIDHIDGNWQNNNEENLRLLCPNCHSLTDTYMNLNRGKGRTYRRKFEGRKP